MRTNSSRSDAVLKSPDLIEAWAVRSHSFTLSIYKVIPYTPE